jgi:hypothetical protein
VNDKKCMRTFRIQFRLRKFHKITNIDTICPYCKNYIYYAEIKLCYKYMYNISFMQQFCIRSRNTKKRPICPTLQDQISFIPDDLCNIHQPHFTGIVSSCCGPLKDSWEAENDNRWKTSRCMPDMYTLGFAVLHKLNIMHLFKQKVLWQYKST